MSGDLSGPLKSTTVPLALKITRAIVCVSTITIITGDGDELHNDDFQSSRFFGN